MAEDSSLESVKIPDHEIVACIGKGAYGRVYRALNLVGGNRAIKVIHRGAFENQRSYP